MPQITFTPNLARLVQAPPTRVGGQSLRQSLREYFALHPRVRGYVLDDQGGVRRHVAVFIDNEMIKDRTDLSDAVRADSDVFIAQALSGG